MADEKTKAEGAKEEHEEAKKSVRLISRVSGLHGTQNIGDEIFLGELHAGKEIKKDATGKELTDTEKRRLAANSVHFELKD